MNPKIAECFTAERNPYESFASELKLVSDAPEPLREAMMAALPARVPVHLLILAPENRTGGGTEPPALFAVLESGWVLVSGKSEQELLTVTGSFADTVQVKLTSILLIGELEITIEHANQIRSIRIGFDTVRQYLFQRALERVLRGVDALRGASPEPLMVPDDITRSLPLKFANAIRQFTPKGQHVRRVLHWKAAFGGRFPWVEREIVPGAVLVETGRHLMLISEEKTWNWQHFRNDVKHGSIVRFWPLRRLSGWKVQRLEEFSRLEIAFGRTARPLSRR